MLTTVTSKCTCSCKYMMMFLFDSVVFSVVFQYLSKDNDVFLSSLSDSKRLYFEFVTWRSTQSEFLNLFPWCTCSWLNSWSFLVLSLLCLGYYGLLDSTQPSPSPPAVLTIPPPSPPSAVLTLTTIMEFGWIHVCLKMLNLRKCRATMNSPQSFRVRVQGQAVTSLWDGSLTCKRKKNGFFLDTMLPVQQTLHFVTQSGTLPAF